MKSLAVALLIALSFSIFAQPIEVPSTWHTPLFKTITFLSDSTLELERGFYPDTSRCQNLAGLAHTICMEEQSQNGLFTQRQQFRYQFSGNNLIIDNPFPSPSISTFTLLFKQVGTNRIQLDFSNAKEYYPHRQHKIEDHTVMFTHLGTTRFSIPWDSLRYNGFTVHRNGNYRLEYSQITAGTPAVATKKGTLTPETLERIHAHIHHNPLLHALIPQDRDLWNTRSSFRQYHTPVPSDGSSFYFNLYHSGFHEKFYGHLNSFPLLIQALFGEVHQIQDSLSKYILQTDIKTIDVEGLNCLYWYSGNPVQHRDIPYDWVQWGGLVQRRIYLLAEDVTINGDHFDCIFWISKYSAMHSIFWQQQSIPPTAHEGTDQNKKAVLKEIEDYLVEISR